MSYPVEPDYIEVYLGDGASPEVFTIVCGAESSGLNKTATTNDRYRRDCAKPAAVATRNVVVTGRTWDLTLNGTANLDAVERLDAAIGIRRNWRIAYGRYDEQKATDAERTGTIYGYYAGPGKLTAFNMTAGGDEAAMELTVAGENWPVWTEGDPA